MEALTKLSEYGFLDVINILVLVVALIVIIVRAVERFGKWAYAKLMYLYNKKRGKEKKEETISDKIKELSANIEKIETQQNNNVQMFTSHEIGIMDKLEQLSDSVDGLSSLIRESEEREKEREKKEAARRENEIIIIESMNAAIALGEATARAVQRIPDAKCNGDMHAALDYATNIKHKHKNFITEQGIEALY